MAKAYRFVRSVHSGKIWVAVEWYCPNSPDGFLFGPWCEWQEGFIVWATDALRPSDAPRPSDALDNLKIADRVCMCLNHAELSVAACLVSRTPAYDLMQLALRFEHNGEGDGPQESPT